MYEVDGSIDVGVDGTKAVGVEGVDMVMVKAVGGCIDSTQVDWTDKSLPSDKHLKYDIYLELSFDLQASRQKGIHLVPDGLQG